MQKRVEIFTEGTSGRFQRSINDFLQSHVQELHDIKFSSETDKERQDWFCALIIYTPFDEENSAEQYKSSAKTIAQFMNGKLVRV
jgi:hypothetical protein